MPILRLILWVVEVLSLSLKSQDVKLTTHLCLVLWLRMSGCSWHAQDQFYLLLSSFIQHFALWKHHQTYCGDTWFVGCASCMTVLSREIVKIQIFWELLWTSTPDILLTSQKTWIFSDTAVRAQIWYRNSVTKCGGRDCAFHICLHQSRKLAGVQVFIVNNSLVREVN